MTAARSIAGALRRAPLTAVVAVATAVVAAGAGALWHAAAPRQLPQFAAVRAAYVPSDAYLLDRDGALLQVLRLDFTLRRLPWVTLDQVSAALGAAIVQAEDRRFVQHAGVDLRALLAAMAQDATGRATRGASTITMQLAALIDPTLRAGDGRRSPTQKLRQMRSAWSLERSWSKDQILEAYLNLVSFRGELQGVQAAAQSLFGKAPAGLTGEESLVLAALLPAPRATASQVGRRSCALARRQDRAADCGSLARAVDRALNPARSSGFEPQRDARLAPQLARILLRQPGERRRSTLDATAQRIASAALAQQIEELADHNVRDAAAVVVDNASGDVLAYVGSVAMNSRAAQVDGVRARRQAGSTLKPFLYGLALQKRYLTAASLLLDAPVNLQTGAGLYVPQDYDREYRGLVSVRSALAGSLNVPAVRTLVLVGVAPFLEQLHAVGYDGIDQPADFYGYALALGSAEVSLLEQANAYRTLANGGHYTPLRFSADDPPQQLQQQGRLPVLSAAAAYIVGDILSDRAGRAVTFGLDSPLATPFWSAVKTGTSKFMRDNWCIGYSSRYTVAVWIGNFDGEPMRDVSGVSGAAPAWLQIMTQLQQAAVAQAPPAPPDITSVDIDYAGAPEPPRREWFIRGTEVDHVAAAPLASLKPRLAAPPGEMVVALDPDIPATHQQVLFRAEPARVDLGFELDGEHIARADQAYYWSPKPGRHILKLVDRHGVPQDQVGFSVRASASSAPAAGSDRQQ